MLGAVALACGGERSARPSGEVADNVDEPRAYRTGLLDRHEVVSHEFTTVVLLGDRRDW